jgi:hypothetical protein
MLINTDSLPTPLAKAASRLNVLGPDASADTFLLTSYLAEAAIKLIAAALYAGLKDRSRDNAYRFAYGLVRADGLGTWERAIYESTNLPLAQLLPPEIQVLVAWLTKKRGKPEDEWLKTAKTQASSVLLELGGQEEGAKNLTLRSLITSLVQIRNKTKAHGAVGQDFFAIANEPYLAAVTSLVDNCPAFAWKWMHLSKRKKGNIRGVLLRGTDPHYMKDSEASAYAPTLPGVYFIPDHGIRAYGCSELLLSNLECNAFLFANGGYNGQGKADFLDYATGESVKTDVSAFLNPPVSLPKSETHGLDAFEVQANIFGNLPDLPIGYIRRPKLEQELQERLLDKNHTVITLHGRGGVGKTCLALCVAHRIASEHSKHFEYIVWFSARDRDLRPSGPVNVKPAVLDLESVAKQYGTLFGVPPTVESFAQVLQSPAPHTHNGILFIFDNFESMSWLAELHKFLDTNIHLPNKVLITSRERAFKADYPIEVTGMEKKEAFQMMRVVSEELGVGAVVTDAVMHSIYSYTEGHAYVIRVIIGEIAKEHSYVPPAQLMSRRMDIVGAVFEHSFNKLSEAGRWVFLTVASWRSKISELALIVTLGQRHIDVDAGIDECRRLSLIVRHVMADGQPCYSAPQLARVFGIKKFEGDPDRLAIQEDVDTLIHFGIMPLHEEAKETQQVLIQRFVNWCCSQAETSSPDNIGRLDAYLESVANLWSEGWLELFQFRQKYVNNRDASEYAIRRAVEEMPFSKQAWLVRARFAEQNEDSAVCTAAFLSAVETDPSDIGLIREAAYYVCKYINDHQTEIPIARRGTYLANIRTHMQRISADLDATGLSRLAWLFLLEGDRENAKLYADAGITKESRNQYCLRILEKLGLFTSSREYHKTKYSHSR